MSVRDVYPRLDSLEPGFLGRDVIRYAKANGLYAETLGGFSGNQLIGLEMVQLHVLPHSHQRILGKSKHPLKKTDKEAQLVSNFPSGATPKVAKLVQTLGNILNPHEVYEIPTSSLSRGGVCNQRPRNMEASRETNLRYVGQILNLSRR